MSELNKGNRGFELMLPKVKKEEEKQRAIVCDDHKIVIFGYEIRLLFSITSFREKD